MTSKGDDDIRIPKDMYKQSNAKLIKGIESDKEEILLHEYKIAHPEEFYKDWNDIPVYIQ